MKVQLTVSKLQGNNKAMGQSVVRFSGVQSKKMYEQPFDGWISGDHSPGYCANIEFPEDVGFHSATSNGPFAFELVSVADDAETHFYA